MAAGNRLLDRLLDRRCEGYVFVGYAPHLVKWLREREVPIVSCYSDLVPPDVPVVMPDHLLSMRQAMECLFKAGHRRIGHLAGPSWSTSARKRLESFRQVAAELGLTPVAAPFAGQERSGEDWGMDEVGIEATRFLLDRGVTAIVAARDRAAVELKNWLLEEGLSVPGDISIVGIDGEPDAADAQLTTVNLFFDTVGRRAFDTLQRLKQGHSISAPVLVPSALIERTSVGPPRA